jgi:hypothetical protein
VAAGHNIVCPNFARQLERENAALRAIIDATLRELPVGNVRAHTPDSISERVGDLVKAHADELADSEQLRKDKARLDWLERPQQITHYVNPFRDVVHRINSGQTLREAIDAAMEAGK